jgi:molecular chaperone DnaJ
VTASPQKRDYYEVLGEKVRVKVPAGTQSGNGLRARGKGMPRFRGKGKGDLFVVVEAKTRRNLTPRQRELLKAFKLEAERKSGPSQTSTL